jgi:hypothetical protein
MEVFKAGTAPGEINAPIAVSDDGSTAMAAPGSAAPAPDVGEGTGGLY